MSILFYPDKIRNLKVYIELMQYFSNLRKRKNTTAKDENKLTKSKGDAFIF